MVSDPFEYARRGAREVGNRDDPFVADLRRARNERTAYQIKLSPPPETVAKANRLSRSRGVPAAHVEVDLPTYEQDEQNEKFVRVIDQYAVLGRWTQKNKRNAPAAADDWESLSLLGKAGESLKNISKSFEAGTLGMAQGGYDAIQELDRFNRYVTYPLQGLLGSLENAVIGTDTMNPDKAQERSEERFQERRTRIAGQIDAARPDVNNWWARNLLAGFESIPATTKPMTTRSGSESAILTITKDQ